MTDIAAVLAANFAILMGCMIALWLLSIAIKDVSFIDSFWAAGFVVVAGATYVMTPEGDPQRRLLLLAITAIWGVRLAGYLLWRWRKGKAVLFDTAITWPSRPSRAPASSARKGPSSRACKRRASVVSWDQTMEQNRGSLRSSSSE